MRRRSSSGRTSRPRWRRQFRAGRTNGFFTSYDNHGRYVSYYGDNHPHYAGNVVKAMASARDGYPQIVELLRDELAALDSLDQDARERTGRRSFAGSMASSSPTVETSSV